jgi:hypothetical protein
MLIVRTKNAITKRVKVEAPEHVNHHSIQNLEHIYIIKIVAASQTEKRGEERWLRKTDIWSVFLDSRGRLLMMPSSSQVPDHRLIY